MTEHDRPATGARDDRLRAHLRAADPAASLAPADAATVAALTRAATSDDGSRRIPASSGATDLRRRAPQLLAAAAVLVVAGVGVWAVAGPEDTVVPGVALDPAPTAEPSRPVASPTPSAPSAPSGPSGPSAPSGPATAPGKGTMSVLQVPEVVPARCMVPDADLLRAQDLAFKGTVVGVEGDLTLLEATEVYAGGVSDVVRVQAPPAELSLLLGGVQFEVGMTYLVSATDGQVTLCGLTAESTPALASLYAEAYGR